MHSLVENIQRLIDMMDMLREEFDRDRNERGRLLRNIQARIHRLEAQGEELRVRLDRLENDPASTMRRTSL